MIDRITDNTTKLSVSTALSLILTFINGFQQLSDFLISEKLKSVLPSLTVIYLRENDDFTCKTCHSSAVSELSLLFYTGGDQVERQWGGFYVPGFGAGK